VLGCLPGLVGWLQPSILTPISKNQTGTRSDRCNWKTKLEPGLIAGTGIGLKTRSISGTGIEPSSSSRTKLQTRPDFQNQNWD